MRAAEYSNTAPSCSIDGEAMGPVERSASMGLGLLLGTAALRPRLLFDIGLVAAAGYLMYRGATGHCPIRAYAARRWAKGPSGAEEFEALVRKSPREPLAPQRFDSDEVVDEASAESFPASDPPAMSASTAAPTERPDPTNSRRHG